MLDDKELWTRLNKSDTMCLWAGLIISPAPESEKRFYHTLSMNHGCIARGSVICTFIVYSFHDTGARPVQFLWETKLRGGCLATAWEPNKEELRVHPETRSALPAIQMASSMAVDKPKQPKLDVDEYLSTAISATPTDLHPYFESFQDLHSRKCVTIFVIRARTDTDFVFTRV